MLDGRRRVGKSWPLRAFAHGKLALVLARRECSSSLEEPAVRERGMENLTTAMRVPHRRSAILERADPDAAGRETGAAHNAARPPLSSHGGVAPSSIATGSGGICARRQAQVFALSEGVGYPCGRAMRRWSSACSRIEGSTPFSSATSRSERPDSAAALTISVARS